MSGPKARGWIAAAGVLLVCAGCGFKGPLYLPERNVKVVTHPAQTPAAKNKGKTSQPSQPPSSPATPPPQSPPPSSPQ